jgi:hypothetical protein
MISFFEVRMLSLVSTIVHLYLNFDHVISVFSLHLDHHRFSIQPIVIISITYISILSVSQHHHYRLNHFKIYFVDNKFEKTYQLYSIINF